MTKTPETEPIKPSENPSNRSVLQQVESVLEDLREKAKDSDTDLAKAAEVKFDLMVHSATQADLEQLALECQQNASVEIELPDNYAT